MASTAYIGIGSNLGDSPSHCEAALSALDELPEIAIARKSSFYKTEPLGLKNQNWFINAVIEIETSLTPEYLLDALLKIEQTIGRVRRKKWGPRVIDLDLLFYENIILKKPGLEVPHPEIANRSCVLIPMAEIQPDFFHPVFNRTIAQLIETIPKKTDIRRLMISS